MGSGVVGPRNFIGNHNFRGKVHERTIPDIVKAIAEGNDIRVGGSGFSLGLKHYFQIS